MTPSSQLKNLLRFILANQMYKIRKALYIEDDEFWAKFL